MGTQFDIIKRPEPWTTILDYEVRSVINPRIILIAPRFIGSKHSAASRYFDRRMEWDTFNGLSNRADWYIFMHRKPK